MERHEHGGDFFLGLLYAAIISAVVTVLVMWVVTGASPGWIAETSDRLACLEQPKVCAVDAPAE